MNTQDNNTIDQYQGDLGAAESRAADSGQENVVQSIENSPEKGNVGTEAFYGGLSVPPPDSGASEQMEGEGPR